MPVENNFFHILLTLEAGIFPLAGKTAFFPAEHLAKHCLAGKSAFFPAVSVANGVFAGQVLVFRPSVHAEPAFAGCGSEKACGRASWGGRRRGISLILVSRRDASLYTPRSAGRTSFAWLRRCQNTLRRLPGLWGGCCKSTAKSCRALLRRRAFSPRGR